MDEFAQTRQPDDLFDDDFTPIVEPIIKSNAPPPGRPNQDHIISRLDRPSHGRNGGQNTRPGDATRQPPAQHTATSTMNTDDISKLPTNEPDSLAKGHPAVRGDRLATGGLQKPKLTETELSARLEAAKLNNARREKLHRMAEADEASFQEGEANASQRRREEGAARRVMDGEREKNRLRKLGSRGGREWDEGKAEEELGSGRGSQYRRGQHGGVAYEGGRPTHSFEDRSQDQERGGAPFGPKGGRGRGGRMRGGFDHGSGYQDNSSDGPLTRSGRIARGRSENDFATNDGSQDQDRDGPIITYRGGRNRGGRNRGGRSGPRGRGRGGPETGDGAANIADPAAAPIANTHTTIETDFPALPTPTPAVAEKSVEKGKTDGKWGDDPTKDGGAVQAPGSWADQVEAVEVKAEPQAGW